MRTLIVDDEPSARRRLRALLAARPDITLVGEASSVATAIDAITRLDPELILLDVRLRDGIAFDIFSRTSVHAAVVFVTAYDEFAVRAFEVSAIDYVLKPVFADRLHRAIDRAVAKPARTDHVCLPDSSGSRFVPVSSVMYVFAQDDYTEVVVEGGASYLCAVTMQTWEMRLRDGFLRVHRSAIVNRNFVERLRTDASKTTLHMTGTERAFPVGRTYLAAVRAALVRA